MIQVENLTKAYDGINVVDSINLTIGRGSIFGFIGPNGAGKTTAINMMLGLIEPSAGNCLINGMNVRQEPIKVKMIIGYLPDRIGFYPNLTARQNLKYFSKFYPIGEAQADKRIKEILDYVGLGKVEKPAGSFSKGMVQRLGLAQLMINEPEVIFMDEPTNGLDPGGVILLRDLIKEQAIKGKTVLVSSHNLGEIQSVCTTIGIISRGKIMAAGAPDEVKKTLQKNDTLEIHVKADSPIPGISDDSIIDATYDNGTAVIHAKDDIRDEIARQLVAQGICLRELRAREKSLEEIFLDTVYRSN